MSDSGTAAEDVETVDHLHPQPDRGEQEAEFVEAHEEAAKASRQD